MIGYADPVGCPMLSLGEDYVGTELAKKEFSRVCVERWPASVQGAKGSRPLLAWIDCGLASEWRKDAIAQGASCADTESGVPLDLRAG